MKTVKKKNKSTNDIVESTDGLGPAPELDGFFADDSFQSTATSNEQSPEATERPAPDLDEFSTDDLFELLSNRRRRYVVWLLKRSGGPIELGTLATQIAAWENGHELSAVTGSERKRAYTSLQQIHLPKMDDCGIIRFDKRSGAVEPTPALEEVTLDPDPRSAASTAWDRYYITLSLMSLVVVVAIVLDIWPIVLIPNLAWMSSLIVSVLSVAVIQHYTEK